MLIKKKRCQQSSSIMLISKQSTQSSQLGVSPKVKIDIKFHRDTLNFIEKAKCTICKTILKKEK